MKKLLLTITVSLVAFAAAHAGEIVKSASATKAAVTQYWNQHNSHGLRVVNTTATTLYTFGGRPYAFFTVDAAEKITGLPVQLAMIYDVSGKVMYALWPNNANQFL